MLLSFLQTLMAVHSGNWVNQEISGNTKGKKLFAKANVHWLSSTTYCEAELPYVCHTRNIIRQHSTLRNFVDYLAANYFVGQFDPNLWNVFNCDNQCSTNNIVESFHSHWNNKIGLPN